MISSTTFVLLESDKPLQIIIIFNSDFPIDLVMFSLCSFRTQTGNVFLFFCLDMFNNVIDVVKHLFFFLLHQRG